MKAVQLRQMNWKKALNMMLQHLDSTKYYRVKSGLFGSRDTISLRKDYNKKGIKRKKKAINYLLPKPDAFLLETDFLRSDKLDFIKKQSCMIINTKAQLTLMRMNMPMY
jgi:hypothetical protein